MTLRLKEYGQFIEGYFRAALWSSTDDDGQPLDNVFSVADITDSTQKKMVQDCQKFADKNYNMIMDDLYQAGIDFWLTRNHHGAGFWDGDWPEPNATKLTDAAHRFGAFNLWVGEDAKIYGD